MINPETLDDEPLDIFDGSRKNRKQLSTSNGILSHLALLPNDVLSLSSCRGVM